MKITIIRKLKQLFNYTNSIVQFQLLLYYSVFNITIMFYQVVTLIIKN